MRVSPFDLASHGPTRVFDAVFEVVARKYLTKRSRFALSARTTSRHPGLFRAKINPMKNATNERIGNARPSTSIARETTRTRLQWFTSEGTCEVKQAARHRRVARIQNYARPDVTASPISCDLLISFPPNPGVMGDQRLIFILVNFKNGQEFCKP